MREADKFTIETLEVPSLLLMERAGRGAGRGSGKALPRRGICACGGGNNGGDGFVCARILLQKGLSVEALCVADKFSADCKKNRDEFEKLGGEVYSVFPRKRFALIVDCLFGTGFSGELEGKNAFAADFINSSGAKVLSADIPSGVSGNNGLAAKNAVRADETLCIGEYKAGVF
ncbi:MAG: NAD(P)H-hydrate epimerase [Christensenellaceae bacterium]